MSIMNPESAMKALEDGTVTSIKQYFPMDGRLNRIEATNVYVGKDADTEDTAGQKRARMGGRSWSTGVYGDFRVVDKQTGKVVTEQKGLKIANLPKITRRFSFIVDGKEYQADHQWRLKSGVYARQRDNGELESQFNLSKGRGFRLDFLPQKSQFLMRYGTTNIQLLPVLRALGKSDEDLKHEFGTAVFARLNAGKSRGDMQKLAKVLDPKYVGTTDEDATKAVKQQFDLTELRTDTTAITLGKPYSKIDADTLVASAKKLVNINRGVDVPDNRDALQFKELWSIEDHIPERITNSKGRVLAKLRNNVDRPGASVRDIIPMDTFNVPIKAYFTGTSLTQQPNQNNPIDMLGGFSRTTILGPGGISSEQSVTMNAKMIDPSTLGVLDPVHTPEGSNTGITAHLTLGVSKRGKEVAVKVYDVRHKKYVDKTPAELATGIVGFADQFEELGGNLSPRSDMVTALPKGGGDPIRVAPNEVDFVMRSPKSMFSTTSNLIPFLPSDQAGRAGMAARHMEQSVPLLQREAPLVQVASGAEDPHFDTFEKMYGAFSAHSAPVSGTVLKVSKDEIVIQGADKQKHSVGMYDHFPLNEKTAFVDSEPLVSVGDKVDKGDIIADTTATKNGTLALGINMRIGYLPWHGMNFEDGIVISESASKKLTSVHLHKPRVYLEKGMQVNLQKYRANFPGKLTDENVKKLDENGVIRKGQEVAPGDILMTVLKKTEPSAEQVMLKGIHKALSRPYRDSSVVWEGGTKGVVTDVAHNGSELVVYVKTEEPSDVGDKFSFRHGNKGVCSVVVPDEEMPKNADGVPLEVILAPDGVPGRINPGQVFETMLGKAAQKTGTTYAVDNFQSDNQHKIVHVHGFYRNIRDGHGGKKKVWVRPYDRDMGYQDIVKDALKETGTPDTEELFDPATGKSFGQVMVGTQYMIKLMHQVEKKLAARSYGYGNEYDATLAPKGGGDSGAQRFGELGTYAMLAHGATANVRDALSYKSDKAQSDVWTAIQTGEPMPAPKTSFAYDKFVAYLNAVGLNVERDGNEMRLVPLTDQQVLAKSNGALTDASKVLRGKDLKPEPGGLFDAKITGGPGGKNFSHIKLTEPLPNPVFEKAITQLLGLTGKQFDDIMAGNTKLGDKTGPAAIVQALSEIDVDKEFAASEAALKTARHSQFDRTYKRYKYLKALKAGNLTAKQAYVQSVIPVIPPVFRPIGLLEGGNLNVDGVNLLYRDLAMMNQKLEESKSLPENLVAPIRQNMYGALESLAGANTLMPGKGGEVKPPGILDVLSGSAPKHSYVHTRLLDRRQDLTMRSVITPDQSLDLNQLGVPREGAFEIFKPFIVKELVNMGYTPLAARDEIEKRTSLANRALEVAVSKRPVLFKRDPVLHKFGIMAFNVKLHDGKALQIHPLVVGGFNADFDGDTMSVFVPVSDAAVAEARKMLPSENLFDTSTGRAMYQPGLAGQLGLYLMTQMGDETKKSFASAQSAVDAAKSGDIKMTDVISVGGKRTTAGRLQVYAAIPENARTDDVLTDRNLTMEKKGLQRVMQAMATKTPKEYPHAINRLKNLGFGYAHDIGFSYEAKDFDTLHVLRAEVLKGADKSALAVRKRADLSDKQKDDKLVEIYSAATAEMNKRAKPMLEAKGSKLYMMNKAGVKPSWEQVQQMVLAPMLLNNAAGRTIPSPVTKSYSEGLDSAGYWVASSGARKGAVEKVQSVQKPGALSKQIVNAVVPYSITTNDCGTNDGIALDVKDTDLLDRYTAKTLVAGHHTFPAGTVITPNVLDQLQHAKISKVVARSALKCTAPHGLCSKCYGIMPGGNPPEVGTNVGVMAGQAFGERGTQLALKEFHTGGVAGAGSKVGSNLDRVIELLKMPETLPNAATLATTTGKVTSAVKNPLGGFDVKVGEVPHYIGGGRELLVKPGDEVGKGDKLSTGSVDPRELMDLTNVDRVQRYMTDELHGAYASEGIRRRNAEVIVKALTNLGTVDDAGDSDEFVKGDPVSLNYVAHQNKQLKNPTQVTPYLRGLETLPLDRSTDWLARLQYRHLKDTFKRGASEGWKSDLHGTSPMPGLVYGAEFGKKSPDEKGPY